MNQSDIDAMIARVTLEARQKGNMTLGQLIAALEACPHGNSLVIEPGTAAPGMMASYRGYYDHIAISLNGSRTTVGAYLAVALTALDATFTGYKGGEYIMDEDTPVWVAAYGDCSDIAVIGVAISGDTTTLATARIE